MTDFNPALFFILGMVVGLILCFLVLAGGVEDDDGE